VLDDPTVPGEREEVTRLVLCTGKLYYDLVGHPSRAEQRELAIGRVELLYPFAENELAELMASYPSLEKVVWAQEEPRNMGARATMESRLLWLLADRGVDYEYVGRPVRASPGEGYPPAHRAEQARILSEALGLPIEEDGDGARAAETGAGAQGNGSAPAGDGRAQAGPRPAGEPAPGRTR
jgi:2-oxoglutarate dehydrogenase E1 component